MADKTRYGLPQLNALYGNHVPYDRGYDAEAGPHKRTGNDDTWNARLTNVNDETLELWVEEFAASFQLSGSSAQSARKREFYPRSFSQPIIRVSGRVANTMEYNRLASFARHSHLAAVGSAELAFRQSKPGSLLPTIGLELRGRGPWESTHGRVKGANTPWRLEGLIKNIQAGAVAHNVAPKFTFDYHVAASDGTVGIYGDTLVTGREIMSWAQVFDANQKRWSGGYQTDPDGVGSSGGLAYELGQLVGRLFG